MPGWLKRDPANGSINRLPADGSLNRAAADGEGCCCGGDCADCSGCLEVLVQNLLLPASWVCANTGGGTASNLRFELSDTTGAQGTFCVTQCPGNPCLFATDGYDPGGGTIDIYDNDTNTLLYPSCSYGIKWLASQVGGQWDIYGLIWVMFAGAEGPFFFLFYHGTVNAGCSATWSPASNTAGGNCWDGLGSAELGPFQADCSDLTIPDSDGWKWGGIDCSNDGTLTVGPSNCCTCPCPVVDPDNACPCCTCTPEEVTVVFADTGPPAQVIGQTFCLPVLCPCEWSYLDANVGISVTIDDFGGCQNVYVAVRDPNNGYQIIWTGSGAFVADCFGATLVLYADSPYTGWASVTRCCPPDPA